MSKLEKTKEKARSLEARDPRGAIEQWIAVLKGQEEEEQPNPDLSIFNRIGDLYLKIKDPGLAADYYDQAVDKYAELGFHNNAIAMCNKVLRNAPGRQTTYLKLAKLYAAKGFMAEAKQHFVEYAERMQKVGKIQQAFAALKEFTDISPESADLRRILEEHLRMYGGEEEHRPSGTGAKAEPEGDLTKSGRHKTSSLVFLDVDAPLRPKGKPTARPSPAPAPPPAARAPVPAPEPAPEPRLEGLIAPQTADPDTSLEIESTSLVEGIEAPGAPGLLEGFETTTQFGDVRLDPGEVQSLRDEVTAEEIPPLAEFEPTVPTEAAGAAPESELTPLRDSEIDIEPPPRRGPAEPEKPRASVPPLTTPKAPAPPRFAPKGPRPVTPTGGGGGAGTAPRPTAPRMPKLTPPGATPAPVKPVVPRRPEPPKRKTVVEVPPLELEPDFATDEGAGAGLDVDAEPLAPDALETAEPGKGGRRSGGFIDLGLDEPGQRRDDQRSSLVFANIDTAPVKPTIEQLEALVADDPDDPEAHQALGEALIEEGDRERGLEELDHATTGFENRGNLQHARDLVEEILRLDPNSVRHRQKQVEFAFKASDKERLIDAYLELADALLRSDLPEKARAVYQRVAEHDPGNARALAALGMLAPVAAPPPAAKPQPKHKGDAEGKTAAKDAKLTVRDHAADLDGDFVDLGAMILEEAPVERDTRMKVADEEPTGDEDRDFQDMLNRFKQGIDENIDEGDFQSHYDLGIAFKEMGLLDEAIAELQKAQRAPDGKLRSSEALGLCFIEKGAFVVAESILRRALDLPASGDQERLGLLYWLGRALEAQGKKPEARELYGRVFAVDIRFMDVGERAKALARAK